MVNSVGDGGAGEGIFEYDWWICGTEDNADMESFIPDASTTDDSGSMQRFLDDQFGI
jgi:hypothetical protein